ncbi:MAG: hypothetical protein PF487_12350 [Bacteroidales bacterium]|jgi:hypothetical protein|nr:hypothetical protein [Bacteroidales bacterium]
MAYIDLCLPEYFTLDVIHHMIKFEDRKQLSNNQGIQSTRGVYSYRFNVLIVLKSVFSN